MPNVLDIGPVDALAKRASERISNPAVAKRYAKLAASRILRNPRCFRPAAEAELSNAPAWVEAALERGETISVYRRNGAMAARLHSVARRINDVERLSAMDETEKPERAAAIKEARRFLTKITNANFDDAARRALQLSEILAVWEGAADTSDVCEDQSIVLLSGRIWRRVTSVAALRAVGREFENCLARTSRNNGYGAMLFRGTAQFWVLRDFNGAGHVVACVAAPLATRFIEVKGPRNVHVPNDHPDLLQLATALGVRPTQPRPPMPPRPRFGEPPMIMREMIEQLQQPCRCSLCQPRAVPFTISERLRRGGATH
ncbi:MAG: hypothetical protein KDA35_05095 [Hyphomonadaceae bacterium]|nr:hypothetical protein [Hyphomonadaceae bacterium]